MNNIVPIKYRVSSQIRNQIWKKTRNQSKDRVWCQISSQVVAPLETQVWYQVHNHIYSQLLEKSYE